MNKKQITQFNIMLATLRNIAKNYQTPAQLRKSSKGDWGLSYGEALEMAYENIQSEAASAIRGLKSIQDT
jgi:hypothetical protein